MKTPQHQPDISSNAPAKKPFFQSTESKAVESFFDSDPAFVPIVQTKLSVGQPGDEFEQEADTMADYVVNQSSQTSSPDLQTKCSDCEAEEAQMKPEIQKMEEEEEMQMKPEIQKMESEEDELQMKSMPEGNQSMEQQLESAKGGGEAIPETTLQEMNQSFGADFSNVRVHQGSQAVQMNQQLGAQAFTNGNNVFFNQGKFKPESSEGKHLLAHELTHTIQQGAIEKQE